MSGIIQQCTLCPGGDSSWSLPVTDIRDAKRPYNGFNDAERSAVTPKQNQLVYTGLITKPTHCSVTNFTDPDNPKGRGYIFMHLEDYGNAMAVLPTSKLTHRLLHARFKNPSDWRAFVYRYYRHGEWYTFLPLDPESQFTPYKELFPQGLPGPWESWGGLADEMGITRESFKPKKLFSGTAKTERPSKRMTTVEPATRQKPLFITARVVKL